MLRSRKFPGLLLTGYLCVFFVILPGRIEGAMLESGTAGGGTAAERAAVARLEELGLDRGEAEARVAALRRSGTPLAGLLIRAGGEPPADYDPPANNLGLVFLIIGGAVAGGAIIGYNASK